MVVNNILKYLREWLGPLLKQEVSFFHSNITCQNNSIWLSLMLNTPEINLINLLIKQVFNTLIECIIKYLYNTSLSDV